MTIVDLKTVVFKDWPSRLVLTLLTLFCGYVIAQGNQFVERKILDTVKPVMDSISLKVDTTDKKVERVDDKVNALIDILVAAFPQVRKAAEARIKEKRDNQEVLNALRGY